MEPNLGWTQTDKNSLTTNCLFPDQIFYNFPALYIPTTNYNNIRNLPISKSHEKVID